jgi:hypothetical protein
MNRTKLKMMYSAIPRSEGSSMEPLHRGDENDGNCATSEDCFRFASLPPPNSSGISRPGPEANDPYAQCIQYA